MKTFPEAIRVSAYLPARDVTVIPAGLALTRIHGRGRKRQANTL